MIERFVSKVLPKNAIKLGLDLKGGIHLVLGVDVDKAIENQLNLLASDLQGDIAKDNIVVTSVAKSPEAQTIEVIISDKTDTIKLQKLIKDKFPILKPLPSLGSGKIILELDPAQVNYLRGNAMEQALETLRNRVDEFGVSEPVINIQGKDRILVQLPGLKDPERAKNLIGKTAQLSFRLVDDKSTALEDLIKQKPVTEFSDKLFVGYDRLEGPNGTPFSKPYLWSEDKDLILKYIGDKIPKNDEILFGQIEDQQRLRTSFRTYLLNKKTMLTGDMLSDARVQVDRQFNQPYVSLRFNLQGAKIFEQVTAENVKGRLAIVLDENIDSAPVIQERIAGGNAQITFHTTTDLQVLRNQAHDLAIVLRAGALPAPVTILEERTVGPSLGFDSIRQGEMAALIGSILVVAFMVFYYRISGLIANLALVLNVLFIMASMALLQATLTVPGIAGIVLTIGMAVDANVLINERIREELRAAKTVKAAISEGYHKALWTVLDSNITTAIAGVVLLEFGTGPIKGFAVTLLIGLLFSVITAITVTRVIFDMYTSTRKLKTLSI
jgi:preprotein translocase subunit SecD